MMEISNIQPIGFDTVGNASVPSTENTPAVSPEVLKHFRQMMEEHAPSAPVDSTVAPSGKKATASFRRPAPIQSPEAPATNVSAPVDAPTAASAPVAPRVEQYTLDLAVEVTVPAFSTVVDKASDAVKGALGK